ncbi:MFS transporter [Cytobacillus sp. Hz8]|uniref:MFS transporter n=1 Tax=Cytobacillus sp. Hz8 TaxID=3347168 RepID=UPI0035D62D22
MNQNRNFSFLLIGQSLANIGDVLYVVSIIYTIYELTESAIAASLVPFIVTTSMFLSSLLTPILISKIQLNWIMAGSQIGKTILLFFLGFGMSYLTAENYGFLFVLIGLIALLDGCANPIKQSLIPHYVKKEQLLQANSMVEAITQLIQATMWFVGSLFLRVLNAQQLIWVVGLLFIMASSILCLLENVQHHPLKSQKMMEQMREGWKTLVEIPVLKTMSKMIFLETIAGTVWIAAILYVFAKEVLHVSEAWWGFINGAYFFGLILGSIYCMKYSLTIAKKLSVFIFLGSFASFGITLVFSVISSPWLALILSFGIGLFGQMKFIPQQTVIQSSVPIEKLSTVYTSFGAIESGVFGLGSLLMGMVADLIGIRIVFILAGVLLAIVSLIVYRSKSLFDARSFQKN